MKSMIFAAGMGTRLKPLTDTMPKALVPVCGKPLIEHISKKIKYAGFDSSVVNVHHFADMLQDWVKQQDWFEFHVSDERKMLLETGGAVLHARQYLDGCGNFLVHNVDVLTNADLEWFANQHKTDSLATLLVSQRHTSRYFLFHPETMRLVGWTNVKTDDTILIDNTLQKEDCLKFAFSGIHIISDRVFDIMEEYVKETGIPQNGDAGPRFSIKDFYLYAASRYSIYGVNLPTFRMLDVGKLDTLSHAEEFLATL